MIDQILTAAGKINETYLVAGGVMLFILFLWNKKLIKKIVTWTVSLVGLALAISLFLGFANGQKGQQVERKPLVKSKYYQDSMVRAERQKESRQ
jgi:predicted tellurium resistance membrane protein TerC